MELQEVSKLILLQVQHNNDCGKDDKFTIDEIEDLIKRRVVNILEPEGVYEKGKHYEGLGTYQGIVDTYPCNANYIKRQHRFIQKGPRTKSVSPVIKINEVLIREIRR